MHLKSDCPRRTLGEIFAQTLQNSHTKLTFIFLLKTVITWRIYCGIMWLSIFASKQTVHTAYTFPQSQALKGFISQLWTEIGQNGEEGGKRVIFMCINMSLHISELYFVPEIWRQNNCRLCRPKKIRSNESDYLYLGRWQIAMARLKFRIFGIFYNCELYTFLY